MIVIHGEDNLALVDKKYTSLELDTLLITDEFQCTNYAIVGPDDIPWEKFVILNKTVALHNALIENYKLQNWDVCKEAIAALTGQIDPFMDDFYDILLSRLTRFEKCDEFPPEGSVFPLVDVR